MTDNVIKKANSISKISGKEHQASFNKIEPYLFELRNLNQGMHYKIDRAPDSFVFQRLMIIPHYATAVVQYMYPVVGLDCARMKTIVVSHASETMSRTLLEKLYISVLTTKLPSKYESHLYKL